MRARVLAILVLFAMPLVPPARAEALAICDIAVLPTKCVAAAAALGSGCAEAEGAFQWPIFGERRVRASACVSAAGSAAAATALAIPGAAVSAFATAGAENVDAQEDLCVNYGTLMNVIACGASAAVMGKCVSAASDADAENGLGVLMLPMGGAKVGECPSGAVAVVQGLLALLLRDTQGVSIQDGERVSMEWEDLPPPLKEPLLAAMTEDATARVLRDTSAWPEDELHAALRASLVEAIGRAFAQLEGEVIVYVMDA